MAATKKTAATKHPAAPAVDEPATPVPATQAIKPAAEPAPASEAPKHPAVVDMNDIVMVQSCFHGNLSYISKRNGSIIEWPQFGEEQPMSVDELMYMRNTQPTFFKEQWVRLIGSNADDVFAFLHLDRYCKNNLRFDTFDDVFSMEPDLLVSVVEAFAPSLRESFARQALDRMQAGTLNDLRQVRAIEQATGFSLLR